MQILNIKMEKYKSKFKNKFKKGLYNFEEQEIILHFNMSFCFLNFDILFPEKALFPLCFNTGLVGLIDV